MMMPKVPLVSFLIFCFIASSNSAQILSNYDLLFKQNAIEHHTEKFAIASSNLIVRRGATFQLTLNVDEKFNSNSSRLGLELIFGPRVLKDHKNVINLKIRNSQVLKREAKEWDAVYSQGDDHKVTVTVKVPPTVAIGIWRMNVYGSDGSEEQQKMEVKENVYMLFNPWCREDQTYLENDEWRNEYVLNDIGKVYMGSVKSQAGRTWYYGQFEDDVLPAVMYLLQRSRLSYEDRSDVVKIARAASSLVNVNDNDGVIWGNWGSSFHGGLPPSAWTGSAAILEQYFRTGGEPVKYGQCWVFGGVLTTVCRTLGIPARTITTFASAHDTDDSLTIDHYFDQSGQELPLSRDSIWNFHVWTESWFARSDLEPLTGLGGWQAIDATPQELSESIFQTGPASVNGIKQGDIQLKYDMHFVFSEVNSDVIQFLRDDETELGWRRMRQDTYQVAPIMFTKAIGKYDTESEDGLEDVEQIQGNYKYESGSEEAKAAYRKAARLVGVEHIVDDPTTDSKLIEFKLSDISNSTKLGDAFTVTIEVLNKSPQELTCNTILNVHTVTYRGTLAGNVKYEVNPLTLKGHERRTVSVKVSPEDYVDRLAHYSLIKVYAMGTLNGSNYAWADQQDLYLDKPSLSLTVPTNATMKVNEPFTLQVEFQNPINRTLTSCFFAVESPGISSFLKVDVENVEPLAVVKHEIKLAPNKAGSTSVQVIFHSDEIVDIFGSMKLQVN